MNERGFTIVEILIVIIVMAILLTLAVVNVRSTQIQGRDSERKSDIENISKALESFQQTTFATYDNTYPATADMSSASADGIKFLMERIDAKSFQAPGITTAPPASLVVATNSVQTTAGVTPVPTKDTFVYQPITKDGALCTAINATTTCRKFNLYYRLEAATPECPAPNNICMVRSTVQ